MKKYFLLIVLSFLAASLFSQEKEKGLSLKAGLAFAKYGKFKHELSDGNENHYPSFLIQVDKAWRRGFRLGAYFGYAGQKNKSLFISANEISYNYYRVGGVVSYDLSQVLDAMNISPESGVQLYASLKTGFYLENIKRDIGINNKENNFGFDVGVVLGGRFNISENIDIFSEFGYGNAGFVTLGFAFDM